MTKIYNSDFFKFQNGGSYNSANVVVPYILDIIKPKSVIDVGCGIGAWLAVFKTYGVEYIIGLDGEYVDTSLLKIPKENFFPVDLSKKFSLDRKFDLVISLEVAEHLPEQSAHDFIESITKLSDNIIFSAAIPCQGGTNHVNEKLPSYWANVFSDFGYVMYDVFRPQIWNNEDISIEYKQNIFLFSKNKGRNFHQGNCIVDIVHPDMLRYHLELKKMEIDFIRQGRLGVSDSFKIFLRSLKNKIL